MYVYKIVKSILCEFSYAELKQNRFVCTNGEYEASSILKSKTQIRFPSASHVTNYITQLDENYCCDRYINYIPQYGIYVIYVYGLYKLQL